MREIDAGRSTRSALVSPPSYAPVHDRRAARGSQPIASIFFTTRCTVSQVRVVMSLP
jgi:hypothetical protein